jgi:hypothetical protein
MIVLDEQLLGRHLEREIAQWYRGKIVYISDLRPHTVIKDDAIPRLLRQQSQPTFVTINEKDFGEKSPLMCSIVSSVLLCLILVCSKYRQHYEQYSTTKNFRQKHNEWEKLFG